MGAGPFAWRLSRAAAGRLVRKASALGYLLTLDLDLDLDLDLTLDLAMHFDLVWDADLDLDLDLDHRCLHLGLDLQPHRCARQLQRRAHSILATAHVPARRTIQALG